MMVNSGDIGAAFSWNVERFKPYFTIHPVKGYVTPGMEVPFEITFAPHKVNQDVRCDVSYISGQNRRKSSLLECIFDNMALYFE